MRILILVEEGPSSGRRWVLRPGDKMTFGRTEVSDIVIENDPLMSSCHFRFSVDGEGCTIEDLESTNGTLVNEQRVSSRLLTDGDSVSAGGSVFTVNVDSAEVAAAPVLAPKRMHVSRAESVDEEIVDEQENPPIQNTVDELDACSNDAAGSTPLTGASDSDANAQSQAPTRAPIADSVDNDAAGSTPLTGASDSDANAQSQTPTRASIADSVDNTPTLRLRVSQCPSCAWQATPTHDAAYQPVNVIGLLSALCPIRLVIDLDRCQIDASDESIPELHTVSGASRLVAGEDSPVVDWVAAGWGRDSIIVLFSYVDVEPMVEHFRAQLPSMPLQGAELTRPSVLQDFLVSGPADLVDEILVPCEAVLIESDEAIGGWRLFGTSHLIELLTMNGIDFFIAE